jgi:transposase
MGKKPKNYSSSFKFKVVMESMVKGNVAEVARQYHIHPNQLSTWRTQFQQRGPGIFESGNTDLEKKYQKKITELENLIGKKEIEANILKRYVDFYVPLDGA